jgi:hypothetical protein
MNPRARDVRMGTPTQWEDPQKKGGSFFP